MRHVDIAPLPLSLLESHVDDVAAQRLHDGVAAAHALLHGRAVYTVTPTAAPGAGPAETVAPAVGYALGLDFDAHWMVMDAPREFVELSARLHAALHGDHGDGGKLGEKQRDLYEHVCASNAANLLDDIREGDIVILHDPPTLGLARALHQAHAVVVWRCHVGTSDGGEAAQRAWAFLDRYLEDVDWVIVSRPDYAPPMVEPERVSVIPPSINPDSPKNLVLDRDEAWSVVRLAGIAAGEPPFSAVPFVREDGRSDAFRGLEVSGAHLPIERGARIVTQVSRWDRLKGMRELIDAFAQNIALLPPDAHLLLVGPTPDPQRDTEASAMLASVMERYELLPASVASRIHIATVPMQDRELNALVINAVQRVSDVVTQRSLVEAFGLTVAEAMWKKAPVVASAVGGIVDQINDGVDGVLVPITEATAWAQAVADLLLFEQRARDMGEVAHESVRQQFLPDRYLLRMADALAEAVRVSETHLL